MDKFVNIGLDMKHAELRFVCRLNNKLDMGLKINPKHLMYNPSDTPDPLGPLLLSALTPSFTFLHSSILPPSYCLRLPLLCFSFACLL